MILVLFGTNPYNFLRLAKAIEDYARDTGEEVIAQLGNTKYIPGGVKCFDFLSRRELLALIEQAELVITQGGCGSILDCLEMNKKTVAVPRKKSKDCLECRDGDSGQEDLVRQLDGEGRLVGVFDIKDLPSAVEKARNITPEYKPNDKIPNLVSEFVQSVVDDQG